MGTPHIKRALDLVFPEELEHLSICWKRVRIATFLSGESAQANIMTESKPDVVKCTIMTTKSIVVSPFQIIKVAELQYYCAVS